MTEKNIKTSVLLHPDLMADEELRNILKMRYIKLPNMNTMNRSELLSVYSRVIIPLQQRSTRNKNTAALNHKNCNAKIETVTNTNDNCKNGLKKLSTTIACEEECNNKLIKLNLIDSEKKPGRKRSNSNLTESSDAKKPKQKITWP